jgi:hypothetical protein
MAKSFLIFKETCLQLGTSIIAIWEVLSEGIFGHLEERWKVEDKTADGR